MAANDTVLDLGCGGGLHVFLLAERCTRVVGLDVGEKWIRRAHQEMHRLKKGRQVRFVCSALENAGFEDQSFDKIFSFSVLEHISNYDQVLKECHRILKPAGSLHFSVDWLGNVSDPSLLGKHRADHAVVRYFSPEEMKDRLQAAGFQDIRIEPFVIKAKSVALFEEGIRNVFSYSYSRAARNYFRIRRWESDPSEPESGAAVYLHVRACH